MSRRRAIVLVPAAIIALIVLYLEATAVREPGQPTGALSQQTIGLPIWRNCWIGLTSWVVPKRRLFSHDVLHVSYTGGREGRLAVTRVGWLEFGRSF